MRTVLFACGLILATLQPRRARAQIVGLFGGRSFSHTSESAGSVKSTSEGQRADLTGGVFVQFPLTSFALAEPQLAFVTKGDGQNGAGLTLRYLEVPILVHIAPELSRTRAIIRPFASFGPSFNFLTACFLATSQFSCHDDFAATRTVELTAVGSVGAEWWTPEHSSIGVEARYETSLTNTSPASNGVKRANHTTLFLARLGGIF
ncbi:MAG TPA: outer membrane beta-barrel protein [Gemmatimonadaceae bacterium]|jgi:hypothetical protein